MYLKSYAVPKLKLIRYAVLITLNGAEQFSDSEPLIIETTTQFEGGEVEVSKEVEEKIITTVTELQEDNAEVLINNKNAPILEQTILIITISNSIDH